MVLLKKAGMDHTAVSHNFIDFHMAKAGGEFVKIYLCLLRLYDDPRQEVSVSSIADFLNDSEKDVLRALNYWAREGLLRLEYGPEGEISSVEILVPQPPAQRTAPAEPARETAAAVSPVHIVQEQEPEPEEDESYRQLLYVAESYMGRPLTEKEVGFITWLREDLHFSDDLIEYVFEYCIDAGHANLRYMEKVAIAWHEEGRSSVQEIKEEKRAFSRANKNVMKAFGITGRVLTSREQAYVDRWVRTERYPSELVTEACERTIALTQSVKFEYADKILKNWRREGLTTLAEVRSASERRREQAEQNRKDRAEKASGSGRTAPAANRFHNFDERSIDYDAMLRAEEGRRNGSDESAG